jgi:signal transduction histidine kinase/CheY-like chemotaxis protein
VDAVLHPGGQSYLLHEAQEKLRQSEITQRGMAETQMAILNALPAHIALLDTQGVILSVNEAWRRFATPNLLQGSAFSIGQNYLEVCTRAQGDCSQEVDDSASGIRRVLCGETKEFILEYPCHSPKEKRWFRLMVTPLEDGRLLGAVVMHVDITERKKLEHQFLRAQRLESIGTLASGIAHDLNNVLAPIMMSLELLKMRVPDPASMKLLSILESSVQHGSEMVRQVLSFGRGVEGLKLEVQVGNLIADLEKTIKDTFVKNIVVRTIISHGLRTVLGDPTQLHQVLLNLCVNARDAMPNGGTLTLSAENVHFDEQYAALDREAKPGFYILVQVEDTGTGIAPEVIEKIFDPFFTTKELGKGTGLGLSTTMTIVRSHSGFLHLDSEVGKGTKFQVYLPVHTKPSEAAVAVAVPELPRGKGELILVIDDEASVREITKHTLEAFGYRVMLASDGSEAVAIYAGRVTEFAAVLTDMMMPVMDGPATIQVLLRINPKAKIIGASGLSASAHVAKVTALGVTHFLPKPYTAETLLGTLRKLLEPGT